MPYLLNALLRGLTLLISGVTCFLTAWIVVPAPTFALLPLGVGAPEISPWLIVANAIAALLALRYVRKSWLFRFVLACSLFSLTISTLPLSQFAAANQRAETSIGTALGTDYLTQIAPAVQGQMRAKPFVLMDALRGIPEQLVRTTVGIPVAAPDGVPLTLTVYRAPQTGKHPTIVVIYGGAWQRGNPNDDAPFSRYMAARGYTVVAIDYRHAPRYQFPAQLEDVKTALTYIQQHADDLEVDTQRLALMGRSAGAHLAMLAAYQTSPISIRAVVNYYGPVDLTKGYYDLPSPDPINSRAVLNAFLGGSPEQFPELYRQASPYNYVSSGELFYGNHPVIPRLPPSLLIYGGRDHLVQAKFGRSLYDRLQATGTRAVWLEIPWAEHAFDKVFNGVSNQLALYYTERFLAWTLR
ncbi:alpha/beta hydrolase [Stenomitos frigidus]|uniref:Esterase n=1 Tax=Stenomitos frigidus ULC18 TaxID=2107698 RepID=A0A2T1E5P8_9CYAN|nr:alpha/beta hydrolase [Stenomitos frigidus]PSB28015.1 esterase [Stenomitos frigidus ULC18]